MHKVQRSPAGLLNTGYIAFQRIHPERILRPKPVSMAMMEEPGHAPPLTLDILKCRKTPRLLPPSIHLLLIWVDLVYACIWESCSCAWARARGGRVVLRMM